jgi:hypothetical protein
MCLRVFVLANESLLADVIVANLTQDTALDVVRLPQHEPSMLHQTIREECSVVIIVEDGESNDAILTANDLLRDYGCFRMITVSLQKHHLQIYDSYQMPISGLEEVIGLAKNFNREKCSEAAK